MESTSAESIAPRQPRGYSRSDVEAFVASAARERARLEAAVSAEDARARQARVSLGTHRVMLAMLLDTHREIEEIRTRAAQKATAILAASVPAVSCAPTFEPKLEPMSEGANGVHIDLTLHPTAVTPIGVPIPAPHVQSLTGSPDYFDFLRGALVDDEPLGPRAD